MQFGFDKSKRLLNAKQYKSVLSKGRRYRSPLFLLVGLDTNQQIPRIGITVSKKVSKRAVDRNTIKRQIREFFRLNQKTLVCMDFVLIAHPVLASCDNKALQQALQTTWLKAGQKIKDIKNATRVP